MKVKLNSLFEVRSGRGKNARYHDVISNILIDTNDITYTGEIYDDKNRLVNDRCKISVKNVGDFIIHDNFHNISRLQLHKKITGFRK